MATDLATPTSNNSSFEVLNIDGTASYSPNSHDVAVVGLSCRTAGGNNTPEQLWDFLLDKKCASGEVPSHRWEPWLQRDPRNDHILQNIIRKGYFLDNLEDFDAAFFGISPKEAELMDPHQRLGLELAWEALENAGINPKSLAGSDTAVYMGVDSDDYSRMLLEDLPNIEAWSGIGTAAHGIPNRISYHLDLKGPSTAVDAACASSLIAIHLAHQAIVSGASTTAICGGVNVICAPGLTHMLQKAGALSPDGVCRSFDDHACGYARGEGGAIVILKKLSTALAENDNILAVLKGTASAQDGKTNGIMAPNARSQEMVARQALLQSGNIDPLTIGYVEAHATSTALGDPTEISAISKAYGAGRTKDNVCFIGSIKPNVGHLEAAAGAIGFVKAVLAVHKAELAPQALLEIPNTKIDWENSGLEVVRETRAWPQSDGPRRAAICCYGYGGSVCNAVIEQAPATNTPIQDTERATDQEGLVTLVLSALRDKHLASHAASLARWLSAEGNSDNLSAIARTLSQRRAAHEHRAAFIVSNNEEAVQALTSFANSKPTQWTVSHRSLGKDISKGVVWVFSGHGAQWLGMGKELIHDTIFREAITPLDSIVQNEMEFSALKALEEGDIGGSPRIQVLTFVVQIGLLEVLKSKGVYPQAIIGHSVGEIAAAVAAGCLSAVEGTLIVARRAKLYTHVEGQGAMAMVNLPFCQVAEELREKRGIVAAINSSPTSCVVSGDPSSVESYVRSVEQRGIQTWRVKTDIAFHSPNLESLAVPLQHSLKEALHPREASVPIYSTSHPEPRTRELRDEIYWSQNMVSPVRLLEAVEAALTDGFRVFLEVSSHPIISHSISETLAAHSVPDYAVFGVMKRNTSPARSILRAIAHLYTLGAHVDFETQIGVFPWCTTVPNTPWVHKPFWKTFSTNSSYAIQQHDVRTHTLLGSITVIAASDIKLWTTILDDKTKPYPLIHPLDGTEIIPAAVYCNTFLRATNSAILENIKLLVPLPMTADQREVQIIVQGNAVRLLSRLRAASKPLVGDTVVHTWVEHSTATFKPANVTACLHTYSIYDLRIRIQTQLPKDFAWTYLQKIGVSGIAFPWAVLEHYGTESEMLVKLEVCPISENENVAMDETSWAPFIDAATSIGSSIFFKSVKMRIVSGIDQVIIPAHSVPPKVGWLFVQQASEGKTLKAHIAILDESGTSLVELRGMRFSDVEAVNDKSSGVDKLVHRLAWIPPPLAEMPLTTRNIVLISPDKQLTTEYARTLRSITQTVVTVSTSQDLTQTDLFEVLEEDNTLVIYVPESVERMNDVARQAHAFIWETTTILKALGNLQNMPKLFVITASAQIGSIPTVLAHAPLHGFARIASSEYPELWGGLIEIEDPTFPLLALRYVQGQSVVRMQDGVPRVPRLRPFTKGNQHGQKNRSLMPKPHGTYLVTGGLGDLGLLVLEFLVHRGARRIVVVSRKPLPPRKLWSDAHEMGNTIRKIAELEAMGATIHSIALDIGSPSASVKLSERIDALDLPPVLGVVHAAGVSGYGYIKDTTSTSIADVMAPKVNGAINLHDAFPPNTLDFFVLFSSIGQLIGTPGQAAYAASNAFLDGLATQRNLKGCNSVSMQWTAWRGKGLAADTELVDLELEDKGVTDISVDEGFQAWEYLSQYDTDHAVVTRTRILNKEEPLPCALIADVVQRRAHATTSVTTAAVPTTPKSGPELKSHLSYKIRQCLSTVLHLDAEDIDERSAIADLGVDSVMTVALRQQLQKEMGVTVPPTLTWNCPTMEHLVEWFYDKIAER
ncbi:hypothetical protein N0V83_007524 [Neocucurbitaria cava]|uniref:6-methylsalicylic acid synthase n=1 Tax=Neocucurbitaria cava TaxID=798079 RepID=A0A9W9CK27_9PLEO|nr:hypothetical protein N0V83_007524 [Neocucurbitaria cava]